MDADHHVDPSRLPIVTQPRHGRASLDPAISNPTSVVAVPSDSARAMRHDFRLLVVIPLLCYAYFVPRGIDWNADSHLDLTRALVDHHTAVIDAYHAGLGDRSYYHGHYYTDKAPGLSLLAVPVYAMLRWALAAPFFGSLFFVTRYLVTVLVVAVPSAVAVALLWRRLRPHVGTVPAAAGVLCAGPWEPWLFLLVRSSSAIRSVLCSSWPRS